MSQFDSSNNNSVENGFLQNPFHPRLTDDEYEFINRAVQAGCAVSALARKSGTRSHADVNYSARQTAKPLMSRLSGLSDTHSIFLEMSGMVEVVDVDCKNGAEGFATFKLIEKHMPVVFAEVTTPSGGKHFYVPATGLPGIRHGGIDVQGVGLGVFGPGSNRGKYPGKRYVIEQMLVVDRLVEPSTAFRDALLELKLQSRKSSGSGLFAVPASSQSSRSRIRRDQLSGPYSIYSRVQHFATMAPVGQRNSALYKQAFTGAAEIGDDTDGLTRLQCVLIEAARKNGVLEEDGLEQCLATINSGIEDALDMLEKGEK